MVCALAIGGYYYNRINEEIRIAVEKKIAAHYTGLSVALGSARLVKGKGIELRGLSIALPGAEGPRGELAYVDEIFAHCDPTIQRLIQEQLEVENVTIRRLKIHATQLPDGTWTVDRLFPPPKLSRNSPIVSIEDATVELFDPLKNPASTCTLRDVNLTLTPQTGEKGAGPFIAQEGDAAQISPPQSIKGRFAGDHFGGGEFTGLLERSGAFSIRGTVENLDISPEMRQSLPGSLSRPLEPLGALRASANVDFQVDRGPDADKPLAFAVVSRLWDGRVEDYRLPYPLTDVRATARFDNEAMQIDELTARCGQGALRLNARRHGFAPESPVVLRASARRLMLDRKLIDALPDPLRSSWSKYQPKGTIDAELQLSFDGRTWTPEASIECLDVGFTYFKFPYRLEHAAGTIRFRDNRLSANLQAWAGEQPIRIEGVIDNPGPDFIGGIDVTAEGPVPLDDRLVSALNPKGQKVVRAFHARGSVALTGRFERTADGTVRRRAVVRLHDCSIKHERFPYPIDRITGVLDMDGDRWSFRELEGRNDSGYITCQGGWTKQGQVGRLWLDFHGTDVPLEDELRDALAPGTRRIWNDFRPRGTVDHLAVGLRFDTHSNKTSVDIQARKWDERQNVEGRALSVEPVFFPYSLERLTGTLRYRDGVVEMDRIRGQHAQARFGTDGRVEVFPNKGWRVRLENFFAERLRTDRELTGAMPESLGKAVAKMNLTGPIGLHGAVEMSGTGRAGDPLAAAWHLDCDMEDVTFGCGVRLDHIFGGVQLAGTSHGDVLRARGRLHVDSMIHRGIQLTDVRGPLWLDNSRVLLGAWAEPGQGGATNRAGEGTGPERLTARVVGGTLAGDMAVSLAGDGRYDVQATLAEGGLARIMAEAARRSPRVTGKAFANVRLTGNCQGTHTLRGGGSVALRNADIYELPVMIALLKILRVQSPDRTAFTTSDVKFRIQGDHVYLDRIDLDGDAISLKGNGEMSLDRTINLDFYTQVGRDEWSLPIVRPLLGEASRQFMLIRVHGTLDAPRTEREMLPGLNETLQQLFPEEITGPAPGGRTSPIGTLGRMRLGR